VAFSADCEAALFGFFLLDALPQNYAQVMKTTARASTSCSTVCWIAACISRRLCTRRGCELCAHSFRHRHHISVAASLFGPLSHVTRMMRSGAGRLKRPRMRR